MDITTLIGLGLCGFAVLFSIYLGGSLLIFVDIPSVVCVGFGVLGSIFIKFTLPTIKGLIKAYLQTIFGKSPDVKSTIDELIKLAETARSQSVFALEKVPIEDAFMKKAMTLAADNRPPEAISSILQLEIDALNARHKNYIGALDAIGEAGPAFGMIGTLIGLVQMLQSLSDPSAIGPAMAVALLTTFYGSCLANILALPMKAKLENKNNDEITNMSIVVAGTLGIIAGENPRLIRDKLSSFLAPSERTQEESSGKGE